MEAYLKLKDQKSPVPLDREYSPQDPWVAYNKIAQISDEEFLGDCNESMDSLLVFAGLFSAVTIAVIVETHKDLKPEPETRMEQILGLVLQRLGNSSAPYQIQQIPPLPFKASPQAISTNVLLFLSLTLSLVAALTALLVKQWTRQVFVGLRNIPPGRDRAREHFFRMGGVKRWKLRGRIAAAPMILHLALFTFFVGLILWLAPLNRIVYLAVLIPSGFGLLVYLLVACIPCIWRDAPYIWPFSMMLKGMFNVWLHTWRTIFHIPRASTRRIHQFIAEEGTNALLEIPLQHQDEYVPSPSSEPASRILITYIDRNQDQGINMNDDPDTSPDDLDLHIVYTMVEDPHSNIPLESMLEVLRRAIYNRPTFQESDLVTKSPTLSHIINRATQIVLACRTYKTGYLDILPGVPLNKATLVMQFFEAAIQIVDFEPEGRSVCWQPLLEMADVLMDRALRGQSLDELVLHASLSIRLQLKLNLHAHLTRAADVLKALRVLGPAPQEFRMTVWPPEEILKYQKVISPYIYSLSLMILRRYSSAVENATSTTTTVTATLANPPTTAPTITQAKQLSASTSLGRTYTPLEDLADHTSNILAAGRIPARFGRSADNYRTLRDVLGDQWINNAGCNADVTYWMRQVLLYTGLAPEVAEDGSHYLTKCFA